MGWRSGAVSSSRSRATRSSRRPKASLAFPETGIGIYPGLGGTQRTPRRVGRGLAKWLVLSGQTIGAEEALAIGMVDKVVAYEQLDATIQEVIAAGPAAARGPKPVPDSHRSIASFFDRHDVDELLAGQATAARGRQAGEVGQAHRGQGSGRTATLGRAHRPRREVPIEQGLALELSHLREIFATKDAYEGLSSLGRKAPVFIGS